MLPLLLTTKTLATAGRPNRWPTRVCCHTLTKPDCLAPVQNSTLKYSLGLFDRILTNLECWKQQGQHCMVHNRRGVLETKKHACGLVERLLLFLGVIDALDSLGKPSPLPAQKTTCTQNFWFVKTYSMQCRVLFRRPSGLEFVMTVRVQFPLTGAIEWKLVIHPRDSQVTKRSCLCPFAFPFCIISFQLSSLSSFLSFQEDCFQTNNTGRSRFIRTNKTE